MSDRIRGELPVEDSLPAAGQGIVGIESRIGDEAVAARLAGLHHDGSAVRVAAERALSARLDGGCQVPIGAYSLLEGDELWLRALVAKPDGSTIVRAETRGPASEAHELGVALAERLLADGADRILAELGLTPAPIASMSTVFHPEHGGAGGSVPA